MSPASFRIHIACCNDRDRTSGNLGAVCCSLLNHGFDSLRPVQPSHPDDIEAVIAQNMQEESSIPAKFSIHSNKRSQIVPLSLEPQEKEKLVKKLRSVTSCIRGNLQKESNRLNNRLL